MKQLTWVFDLCSGILTLANPALGGVVGATRLSVGAFVKLGKEIRGKSGDIRKQIKALKDSSDFDNNALRKAWKILIKKEPEDFLSIKDFIEAVNTESESGIDANVLSDRLLSIRGCVRMRLWPACGVEKPLKMLMYTHTLKLLS